MYDYPDVIIFSTKGQCSLASLLSGGDYDGDLAMLIWAPAIVETFSNSPFTPAPQEFLGNNFEREVESVDAFRERAAALPPGEAQKEFQSILLLGLSDSKVGLYSNFHDNATYAYGYADPRTIRLAYMYAHLFTMLILNMVL